MFINICPLLVLLFCGTCFAATFLQTLDKKPGFEDHCFFFDRPNNKTLIIPVGADLHPTTECIKYSCTDNGDDGHLQLNGYTCGTVGKPCYTAGLDHGTYPDCCTPICPNNPQPKRTAAQVTRRIEKHHSHMKASHAHRARPAGE